MRKQKKLISLLLALVLVVGLLAGCGQTDSGKELVGKWAADWDLSELMNEELSGMDLGMDFSAEGWTIRLDFAFNDDGTMEMSLNEDSLTSLGETMKTDIKEALTAELEKTAEEQGVTLDELLEAADMDLDSMIDEMGLDPAEMFDSESMNYSGKYAVKGDRLYTADSGEPSETNGDCLLYELKDGELHLDVTPEDDSEEWNGILPLVLKKQG